MKSNSSQLIENEVMMKGANNISTSTRARNASYGYERRQREVTSFLTKTDLSKLRELIGSVWLVGYSHAPEVDQIVNSFNRVGSNFTSRLAVRAHRLEQELNVAQERIIRLEWTIAQANKIGHSG